MPMYTNDEYQAFYRENYQRLSSWLINKKHIPISHEEDVAHEIFECHIKAMKGWLRAEHEPTEAIKYLFGIADNVAKTWWRKYYKALPYESIHDDAHDEQTFGDSDQWFQTTLEDKNTDELVRVLAALDQLPPIQREVFILCYFEGKNHREICTLYSWKAPSNVSRILKQARKALRALLT